MTVAWLWLFIAIIFEVAGTTSLKISAGLSRLFPSILVFIFYSISFATLSFALKNLEISLAYAIWAGLGTALIALIGVGYFNESLSILKVISIILIILGVIGLNLAGSVH